MEAATSCLYTVDVQTLAIYSAILLNAAVWLFSTSPSSQRKEHGHCFILLRGFLGALSPRPHHHNTIHVNSKHRSEQYHILLELLDSDLTAKTSSSTNE
jgi:hypothetical protein